MKIAFVFKAFIFLLLLSSNRGFCSGGKGFSLSLSEYIDFKAALEEFSQEKRSLLEMKLEGSLGEYKESLRLFKQDLFKRLFQEPAFKKKL